MANRKGFNDYVIEGDIAKIIIIRRSGERFEVIVDADKIPMLIELGYRWHIWKLNENRYYARHSVNFINDNGDRDCRMPYLHHLLMEVQMYDWHHVYDHINNNTLDNRRENLRPSSKQENDCNRTTRNVNNKTGYRNVCFSQGKYIVQLQIKGKNTRLGSFDNVEDAGRFAEEMRQKYYGDYAGGN